MSDIPSYESSKARFVAEVLNGSENPFWTLEALGGIPELNTKWHQHPISEEWDCRVYYDAPVVGDEEDCTYSVHWSVREMSIYQATQPQENSHE